MDTQKLEQALEMARCADAEPRGEPQAEPVRECADNDSPWLICKPCAAVGRCAKLPVAWRSKERINGEFDSGWKLTSNEPPQTPRTIAIEPLYIHPPQQRKPLTKVQITELAEQCGYDGAVPTVRLAFQGFKLDDFARAIERHYGIEEAPCAPTYTEQQIADACMAAEVPDSKCESVLLALRA